jgi:SAM-dependent methyltransferase
MTLRKLLVINAIVLGGSGIGAVLVPARVLSLYGVTPNPAAILLAQYAGLGSIAIGLVTWFARNVEDSRAQRAIILALLITYVIGVIISILGTISGVMKVGWPVVGLYLLLALGYAYFQFMRSSTSQTAGICFPVTSQDKSRFIHGAVYHMLYDRPLAEARKVVVDFVPEGSSVLDLACGTGELCFELTTRKNCQVVGVDLSHRMIEFARRRNRGIRVRFEHGDATDLADFAPDTFDFATILFLLHEVPREKQIVVLNEALRVARKVVIVDSQVPLPRNLHGIALRAVEASGGPGHYRPFADYLAGGGIGGILADSRIRASLAQRFVFWHGCREMIVVERHP